METYVILGRYTQQGAAKIKEGPARIEAVRKAMEKVGGKMVAWYLTMGRYDFVVIVESPKRQGRGGRAPGHGGPGKRQHGNTPRADRSRVQKRHLLSPVSPGRTTRSHFHEPSVGYARHPSAPPEPALVRAQWDLRQAPPDGPTGFRQDRTF